MGNHGSGSGGDLPSEATDGSTSKSHHREQRDRPHPSTDDSDLLGQAPIDDGGATTDYSFDTLDRQVSMEFADGSTRITPRDLASDVITYTDENGSVFANTWDCMGRKTDIAIAAASGIGGTRW